MKHWSPDQELAAYWEPTVRVAAPADLADAIVPVRRRLVAWSMAGLTSIGLWALIYQGVRGLVSLAALVI